MLHALTGDDAICVAFERSVFETMRQIEKDMATRVRIGGEDIDRTTGNLVWSQFTHLATRPVGYEKPEEKSELQAENKTDDQTESDDKAKIKEKLMPDPHTPQVAGQVEQTKPEAQSGAQSGAQWGAQSTAVLHILSDAPLSAHDISEKLKMSGKSGALKRTLKELLDKQLIEYTIPDKPTSRLQKYRLTPKGKSLLTPSP